MTIGNMKEAFELIQESGTNIWEMVSQKLLLIW